jgi:DNA-binding response OmpR family regulator
MSRPPISTLDIVLSGRRVLVVEDEWFIADEISAALDRHHAHVVGPVADVDAARALLRQEPPDCAVLDINLRGEMVFALADELAAAGVGVVFATGYDAAMIPPRFADAPRFEKPLKIEELLRAVAQACPVGP